MTYPPQPPPPPVGPAPKPKMATWKKIGIGVGVFFLLSGCVAAIGDMDDTDTAPQADASAEPSVEPSEAATEEDEAAAPEEEPEPEPEPEPTVGDGVHRVGDDIDPGVYTTDGPDPDGIVPMCYYARLSGLSGELDDVIANNNIEGSGTVEVSESDAALELSGGCEWELLD